MEPNQLGDKAEVRIDDFSPLLNSLKSRFIVYSLGVDQVAEDQSRRSGNSLHTMDVDFTFEIFDFLDKLDGVIEYAFYILADMVLQMISLVFDSLLFVIIRTIVSRAVDHMSYPMRIQDRFVPSHKVRS